MLEARGLKPRGARGWKPLGRTGLKPVSRASVTGQCYEMVLRAYAIQVFSAPDEESSAGDGGGGLDVFAEGIS